jgi:predicted molibdopterin-dependent oxidoreductase YjgC
VAGRFLFSPEPDQLGEADALLRRREKVPNLRGGEALGFGADMPSETWDGLARAIEGGQVWGLYIVDRDAAKVWGTRAAALLSKPELTVFQGPFKGGAGDLASWRFPATAFIEEEGAFTNFEGVVQPYRRALEPLGQARPDWAIFDDLRARSESPAEPAGALGRTR